jgi:hypothetical protein
MLEKIEAAAMARMIRSPKATVNSHNACTTDFMDGAA